MRHRVFLTAHSILTPSTLRMCVIVFFFSTAHSMLTSSTLRRCVLVFFQMLTQCSHLRLLVGASSCFFNCSLNAHIFDSQWVCHRVFSTAHSILTSSTLRLCVIVFFQLLTQYSHLPLLGCASSCFFNCSLNTHIFHS